MKMKTFSEFLRESDNFVLTEKDIRDHIISKIEKMKLDHKRSSKKLFHILKAFDRLLNGESVTRMDFYDTSSTSEQYGIKLLDDLYTDYFVEMKKQRRSRFYTLATPESLYARRGTITSKNTGII